jgi:hypothetical protein
MYSERYRNLSQAGHLLSWAWNFALADSIDQTQARELLDRSADYFESEQIQNAEYDVVDLLLPVTVLREVLAPFGQKAYNAIEQAADGFEKRINWAVRNPRKITSWRITRFFQSSEYNPETYVHNDPYSDELKIELYRYSRETFNEALRWKGPPRRGMFDHIPLVIPQAMFDEPPDEDHPIPIEERGMPMLPPGVVWYEPRVIYKTDIRRAE